MTATEGQYGGRPRRRAGALGAADRALGRHIREATRIHAPAAAIALGRAGRWLSPSFRMLVAVLVILPNRRADGLAALGASVSAATAARIARTRIDRRRPGDRTDGGFPSRHAAAATAIVTALGGTRTGLGRVTAVAAAAGLLGRVTSAEHEPADIVAGAALGFALGRLGRRFVSAAERIASLR